MKRKSMKREMPITIHGGNYPMLCGRVAWVEPRPDREERRIKRCVTFEGRMRYFREKRQ